MLKKKKCWILTNGNAGFISQALGLAESIGFETIEKKVVKRSFLSLIMPLHYFIKIMKVFGNKTPINNEWPDVLISCGAQTIPWAKYIKQKRGNKVFSIYIQNPKQGNKYFDMIVAMEHDKIKGENIIKTKMALNRVTQVRIKEEESKFSDLFCTMKAPFYTVAIGGSTKKYPLSDDDSNDLINKILSIKKQTPGSLLISPSRRTPDFVIEKLYEKLGHDIDTYIVDLEKNQNPYLAMLSISQKIFVTNDSVSMISEACAAGKQVYVIPIKGFSHGKPYEFSKELADKKFITLFDGGVIKESKVITYNETSRIAKVIQELIE